MHQEKIRDRKCDVSIHRSNRYELDQQEIPLNFVSNQNMEIDCQIIESDMPRSTERRGCKGGFDSSKYDTYMWGDEWRINKYISDGKGENIIAISQKIDIGYQNCETEILSNIKRKQRIVEYYIAQYV